MTSHEWILVLPTRGGMKWHLWHTAELLSICGHVDKRRHELISSPPHRRFFACQACGAYARRNNLKLPKWAITPNRKRATT